MVGTISAENVHKQFINPQGEIVVALENVNLTIEAGSFISFIGPSGCGKSTLLRLIAGLIEPDSGKVKLDDDVILAPGVERGFMFQEHTLFPWMSIYENIAFGLKAQKKYRTHHERVPDLIRLVGLEGFEKYYPHQLSGGMCQRAALARALAGRPKVLLLDEPLGALDAFTRMNMQDEILRIKEEEDMTMIMVTHDVDEAVYLSDEIAIMTPRPGKIIRVIKVDLPHPRNRSSNNFLSYHAEVLKLLDYGSTEKEPDYYL